MQAGYKRSAAVLQEPVTTQRCEIRVCQGRGNGSGAGQAHSTELGKHRHSR